MITRIIGEILILSPISSILSMLYAFFATLPESSKLDLDRLAANPGHESEGDMSELFAITYECPL